MKNNSLLNRMLIVAMVLLVNTSCEKSEVEQFDVVTPNTEDGNIAKAVIGRGYDICGRFAYSEDIKEAVLDFNQLADNGKILKDGNIASSEVKIVEGETIEEYQVNFSYAQTASAGLDGLFSAEVGVNFGYSRAKESGYSFATVTSYTYKYGIYLDDRKTPTNLYDFVSDDFLNDAASMSIEKLIETYGTHAIVGGKWGASFDYSMSAKRTSVSNEYSFGAFTQAEATLEGISVGGSTEISSEFSNYFETSTKSVYTEAKGGNAEYALAIATASTNEGRDAAYSAWIETIDGNPAFCDYYEGGLVPIYEFIEDENLRNNVKTGVESYLADNDIESITPVETNIISNFNAVDFCHVTDGDGEIDADGGGDIYVEVTIAVEKDYSSNNLKLNISMKVEEKKGDYTTIEGQTSLTIVNNNPINSIELANTSYTFAIEAKFNPDNGEYLSVDPFLITNPIPSWLDNIKICIDGSGDDEDYIGIKGKVDVPVTVYMK